MYISVFLILNIIVYNIIMPILSERFHECLGPASSHCLRNLLFVKKSVATDTPALHSFLEHALKIRYISIYNGNFKLLGPERVEALVMAPLWVLPLPA